MTKNKNNSNNNKQQQKIEDKEARQTQITRIYDVTLLMYI